MTIILTRQDDVWHKEEESYRLTINDGAGPNSMVVRVLSRKDVYSLYSQIESTLKHSEMRWYQGHDLDGK